MGAICVGRADGGHARVFSSARRCTHAVLGSAWNRPAGECRPRAGPEEIARGARNDPCPCARPEPPSRTGRGATPATVTDVNGASMGEIVLPADDGCDG
jgi:hypothetical protein